MNGELPESLRASVLHFNGSAADFRDVVRTARDTIERARERAEDPPAGLQEQVAEYFRTGKAGPALQTLQVAVDSGAATWPALAKGEGDPATVGVFNANVIPMYTVCKQLADGYGSGTDINAIDGRE